MKAFLDHWLGLHAPPGELAWAQIAVRTTCVFLFGAVLVRVADRRFLGRNAGFDVLLAVILGSVLSRAINGQAPFFETLGASLMLVLLHRGLAWLACRWSAFSRLVKGDAIVLVRNGKMQPANLRRADISEDDLRENLRLNANVDALDAVAHARLERNGQISVVKQAK
jgi:uncharacterized membrane protein YcaP (DUF421 family)